jgi:hydroxymethylbilane synthase
MMKRKWTIGTRGSKLALKQTDIVIERLRRVYGKAEFQVRTITTKGDTVWDRPIHLIGGKGVFVKEIEEALLKREIDMAVHSMKDLPSELDEGLVLGAVLEREDPRDVFISLRYGSLEDLPNGSRIGTNSLRRKAQLLHLNRGINVIALRGNVDTRIRKMKELPLDGIILAYAGVQRMGFNSHIRQIVSLEDMVPPSGQGVIGIETRDEPDALHLLKPLNHPKTFEEIRVERKLQGLIGGGCQVPLGIYADIDGNSLTLYVSLGKEDGDLIIHEKRSDTLDRADNLIADIVRVISRQT